MKSNFRIVLGAASVAAMCFALPAFSASYYVDQGNPRASDGNPGSETSPWKTLYPADAANLQPGDVVIVKTGTYDMSSGGEWSRPVINPRNSGTPDKPITFRSEPQHAAILVNGSNPVLGSFGRNYITIDGFVVRNTFGKGLLVMGYDKVSRAKGVVFQNNIIERVWSNDPTNNTDGIRVENADAVVIRNNYISDVHNGNNTFNASGIKLYSVSNAVVENNEIYDVAAGIFDKEAGVNNTFRRNYIHDCNVLGIQLYNQNGVASTGNRVYENVIDRCGTSVTILQDGAAIDNVRVYNNVFSDYVAGMYPAKSNGIASIYNNIFVRSSVPPVGDFFTYNDPPNTVALLDYNLYVSTPKFTLGRYQTDRIFTSLGAWQTATGFDRHSLVGAAAFVNAGAGDFRLGSGSMAKGAGREGGLASGAVVDMGAYPAGSGAVGVLSNSARPSAPVLIDVR